VDEYRDILLHCNILCSQLSFTANMEKKSLVRTTGFTKKNIGIYNIPVNARLGKQMLTLPQGRKNVMMKWHATATLTHLNKDSCHFFS
jgi:hypothetical protein